MHVGYKILRFIQHYGWLVLERLEIETFIIKLPHFKSNLGAKSFSIGGYISEKV